MATVTVTHTTRNEFVARAHRRDRIPMRMLPLLVVFALLAAGIGFALAAGARPIPSERLRVGAIENSGSFREPRLVLADA